jgi:hypothetical protein
VSVKKLEVAYDLCVRHNDSYLKGTRFDVLDSEGFIIASVHGNIIERNDLGINIIAEDVTFSNTSVIKNILIYLPTKQIIIRPTDLVVLEGDKLVVNYRYSVG